MLGQLYFQTVWILELLHAQYSVVGNGKVTMGHTQSLNYLLLLDAGSDCLWTREGFLAGSK